MSAGPVDIPSETNPGTEVPIVIMRKRPGGRMIDCFKCQIGSIQCLRLSSNQVKVLVPPQAKVQREIVAKLPIILEIYTEHLGTAWKIEIWIAGRRRHAANGRR